VIAIRQHRYIGSTIGSITNRIVGCHIPDMIDQSNSQTSSDGTIDLQHSLRWESTYALS